VLDLLGVAVGHALLAGVSIFLLSEAPLRTAKGLRWPTLDEVKGHRLAIGVVLAVIVVHFAAVALDPWVTANLAYDATRDVWALEGNLVASFQNGWTPAWLEPVWLLAYLFGYPFLIYFTPLFLLFHNRREGLLRYGLAFGALYAMTIPFYLFVPVQNPWIAASLPWWDGPPVLFMLQERWPGIVPLFWGFTTSNNVLPSLHAGISLLCAVVAWREGLRKFALLAGFFALAIPPASFWVGVHWVLDPLVAYVMVAASLVLADRYAPRIAGWAGEVPAAEVPPVAAEQA
jgi:hypothetical protein